MELLLSLPFFIFYTALVTTHIVGWRKAAERVAADAIRVRAALDRWNREGMK